MDEDINIKFKNIFYFDEKETYIPLFKENSKEEIIKLFQEIYDSKEQELILKILNFIYEMILKCYDIAIILVKSPSLTIENNISFIELLIEIYMKFSSENNQLKEKILEILKFLIENIPIDIKHYIYIFKSIINKDKNASKETFNKYIDILKTFYPKIDKLHQKEKKEKYFFFYNTLESGIQLNEKIDLKQGFAFKFWFYIEKYHKNENSNLIKLVIGDNIIKLNLTEKKINIIINEEIKEGLSYEIKEEKWNCIIFGITKTKWENLIIFSYKLETNINNTIIKSNPIELNKFTLDSVILFENFIGRVSSILFYNVDEYSIIDYFQDNNLQQIDKNILKNKLNPNLFALFSPQTLDYEKMEIEDPINHYKAFYVKNHNFYLNYVHKLQKKINNIYNYFGIEMFYPLLDLIYEKYNNDEGVSLFNRIFEIISYKIDENLEITKNNFFSILTCYLNNYKKCFFEDNCILNDFLYRIIPFFTSVNPDNPFKHLGKISNEFLTNILFNCQIMSKFSEKQQVKFWDFIQGKLLTFKDEKEANINNNNMINNSNNKFEKYFNLDYLKTFFIHEFKKDFDINDDRNIIKVIKILFENENNINEKSNKDKLFFFRFLLNPKINFQKVEFMVNLFNDYIRGIEKFPKGKEKDIIKYFIQENFICDLFLIFTRYSIEIKELVIQIIRHLFLNYYDISIKDRYNKETTKKFVKILDKFFLYEFDFYEEKKEKKEEEENEITINENSEKKILKMNLEDNKLFLILDIFHLILRLIVQFWINDNLEFEYEDNGLINIEKVKTLIIKSLEDIIRLINEKTYVNKNHQLFLRNNFIKCLAKIYYDNYLLKKKEDNDLKKINDLLEENIKKILIKLTDDLIYYGYFPSRYISYLLNLNFKIYKDKKDIKEEYSFIKYFFEVFKLEKINEFKELINKSYKEFIEHSGIVGANLFQDNKIFTFSQIHSSKIFDCLKLREDYIYKNFSFLKNADIVKNIFYYSIYLIHDGYIQENLKSLNEYFALFFILICCDIQHKFEGSKNSNESLLYNILEYFFDFFFTNFFIFYYSNIEQKEFKKIFYNILRISRIMSDLTKKNSLFSSYTCNPKSKIISSLKKFQIIKIIQDNNQNDNNQYSYLNDGLMELFTSNDDNIILDNIEKNLQNKKEMNLQIIRDLYEKENDDFDKEQIYDIKKEVKNFYLERKKNFNKEYLKNKNKEDYIREVKNYKIYRKYKKYLFSYNAPYSDLNIFYTKEGKKKLKYKVSNHLTKEFSRPLIIPILNINHYLPIQFKSSFFKDDINNVYKINTHLFENENNNKLNFINIDYDDFKPCCLVKVTHHIIGFMLITDKKIEFFGKKNLNVKKDMTKYSHYDTVNQKCFGSFIEDYHKKDDYYLKIKFNKIKWSFERSYYYSNIGIEIYTKNQKSYFFVFENPKELNDLKRRLIKDSNIYDIKEKWLNNEMSTFKFIMLLNIHGNRSFKDLTQYPIFPWVYPQNNAEITYINNKLNFLNLTNKRDLNKPMGSMDDDLKSKLRKESYIENFDSMKQELITDNNNNEIEFNYENYNNYYSDNKFDWEKIPYYYGSHYSNQVYVSHYLNRIFPFTFTSLEIQSWQFDLPERLFSDLDISFNNSLTEKSDVRELIPEFFFMPEIFQNINNLNLGIITHEDNNHKIEINNVNLPSFTKNRFDLMIIIFKMLLEQSPKELIFEWVNLIFGEYQYGNSAVKKCNVFLPYVYEKLGVKKLNSIQNNEELNDILRLYELGVVPKQLFNNAKKKIKKKNSTIPFLPPDIENCQFNCLNITLTIVYKFHCVMINKSYSIQLIRDNYINEYGFSNKKNEEIKINSVEFSSYKKFLYVYNDNFIIITGFYNGYAYIIYKNKEAEEIRIKNKDISNFDKSIITALEINKSENILYLGTDKGSIIIYKIKDKIHFHKIFRNNYKRINYIQNNDYLSMFITCSEDGFINLYSFPKCDLVGSIYNKNICEYVFLFNFPLPSFSTFSKSNSKFLCYTLNGNEINLNEFNSNLNDNDIEDEQIFNPIVYTNKFNDYLIYISNFTDIVIRKAPYLDIIHKCIINKFSDKVLLSSIREFNNNIFCAIVYPEKTSVYFIKNNQK